MQTQESALETLAREELGIDPDELGGSAWEAAITSFLLFAIGAIIPVIAFFFLTGIAAIVVSIALSIVGLFVIGAAITLFTGRSVWLSGCGRCHLYHWPIDRRKFGRVINPIRQSSNDRITQSFCA
jgi:VIT1/CCC1 family predicted Fe2+/Mn2+ transporter